jgi:hypothetical protein
LAENYEEDEEMSEKPSKEEIELRAMLRDFFEKVADMPMKEQIQIIKDFLDVLDMGRKEILFCSYEDEETQKIPVVK